MSKRLEKNISSLDKIRNSALKYISAPFKRLSANQKFWIGFAFLCLATTLLINNPFWGSVAADYNEGDIARESIISPADITVENKEESERIKKDAVEAIQPIFNYEPNRSEESVQYFRSAWEKLQRSASSNGADQKSGGSSNSTIKWDGAGGEELGRIFTARRFSNNELEFVTRVLKENASGSIYGDQDKQFLKSEVLLFDRQKNQQSIVQMPESLWISLSTARDNLRKDLEKINSLSKAEVDAFEKALDPLIQPNVIYDSVATKKAKDDIITGFEPVTVSLKRGQMIVREGDMIDAKIMSQIEAIKTYGKSTRQWNRAIGLFLLIIAMYWIAWKFIQHRGFVSRLDLSEEKTFVLFGFVMIIQTALMAISFRIADFTSIQNVSAPYNDPTLWALAIPFAFPSLLMTLLADRRTALFTGVFCSLLAGLLAPKGLEFAIYAFITSAVAVYGIGHYRSRQSVTIAGAMVGVSSALTAVSLLAYTQQPLILNTILLAVGCGLIGGLVTSAASAVFLPICETFFGIMTDVKLLELSNADLPILGKLALRAPGTNQHSHAVGQLAEEACRKVGANGLLSRIGALYHDIGKTAAPEHFVENQRHGNPHDELKPAQSAKIIISHVTYGTKLAKEMGLPARIVDFIPQHHGTRTLHYFLSKAKAEAGKGEEIDENDFRYPGPKPQFKESAIMMIADSCEAAARSLSEPTPENIRFIVTKIIDAILSDDQLDECDLSLRELTQIRESMIKSLVSIYHSRVDYPGYTPPSKSLQNIIIPKDLDEGERGTRYKDPADIPISRGGEVEDEAIHRSVPTKKKEPEEPKSDAKTAE
ncbi:MAG: HDIG domain-containing protein [Pyrinomonadaceae bacterium]|nr:HDIG domain-containing protein [Pyrinomonadaceae bacterium]